MLVNFLSLKKHYILALLIMFLIACGGESNQTPGFVSADKNILSSSLTGTWLSVKESNEIITATNEIHNTVFLERRYIIEETYAGIFSGYCSDYLYTNEFSNVEWPSSSKTNTSFYSGKDKLNFELQPDNSLESINYVDSFPSTGAHFETVETLVKVSNEILIDDGDLSLSGSIQVDEQDRVCFLKAYSPAFDRSQYSITVPYEDYLLQFSLKFAGDLPGGEYQYENVHVSHDVDISVIAEFNSIAASDVTINIETSNEFKAAGNFSFIGLDDGSYNGSFEMLLY